MKVVIIQPPIVQLNTPYPSGAYLQDFFKKLKSFGETDNQITTFTQSPTLSQNAFKIAQKAGNQISSVEWKDLSIELFHRIFSKEGLKLIFHKTENKALKMALDAENQGDEITAFNLRRYVLTKNAWINWIDKIMALLVENKSGRETLHEFVRSAHVPRGSRMETYLAGLNREVSVDDGYMLSSLALADLADYITAVYDNNFALIRYAESICASDSTLDEILKTTESPVLKDFLSPIVDSLFKSQSEKTLFCVSIPFPGTFSAGLFICKQLKSLYGDNAIISIGGGYVNTALRSLDKSTLSEYVDFISYDKGYGFYTEFLNSDLSTFDTSVLFII